MILCTDMASNKSICHVAWAQSEQERKDFVLSRCLVDVDAVAVIEHRSGFKSHFCASFTVASVCLVCARKAQLAKQ